MTRPLLATTVLLLSALLLAVSGCETGFDTDPRRRNDDDVFGDDDSSDDDDSLGDDDDSSPTGDDDDSSPTGDDDDSSPTGDDDSSPPDNFEGDEPGECSDGADNDQDGLFDCDDPDCFGSPDCAGDDDASPGDDDDTTPGAGIPEITGVTYVWIPADQTFEFSISIIDLDCDLTPVILYWSTNGSAPSAQPPAGDPSPPVCSTTYLFGLQLLNAAPGISYSMVFSVEDSSGNRSADYSLTAQVPP